MIYLLRHGETESDGVRRFIGQTDIHLNSVGRRQAAKWKKALSIVSFDAIYASDLSRCAETARIISGDAQAAPQLLPELREIRLGDLEGLSMDEFRFLHPDIWTIRGENIADFTPDGGESFLDLQHRSVHVFDSICRKHRGHILIITHAGVIRTILCHILEIPLQHLFRLEQSYACLTLLEPFKASYRLIGLNLNRLP